jgi:hypothetical protein
MVYQGNAVVLCVAICAGSVSYAEILYQGCIVRRTLQSLDILKIGWSVVVFSAGYSK